jgi:bifunctional non-homologous end joining protein LigD
MDVFSGTRVFLLKWDGFRAIAERDHAGHVSLYSRNHRDFAKRFPPIVEALSALKRPVILDWEIVALDEQGHSRFEWLVNRGKQQGTLFQELRVWALFLHCSMMRDCGNA